MRPRSRAILLLCAGLVAPALPAQSGLVGLEKVQQLFTANQARAAARELNLVSVEFRNEIGRCRDESIGARLMELEPRIDQLSKQVGAGSITSFATLEKEFVVIDRALAENHHHLAVTGWGLRRFGRVEGVGKDLALAARYLERSARWAHAPLPDATRQAVADALAVAEKLVADPEHPPAETGAVIEAFGKALKGAP